MCAQTCQNKKAEINHLRYVYNGYGITVLS